MVIRGPHNAKIHAELDSSYQKTCKMTYCTVFRDSYLEKVRLSRMASGGHLGYGYLGASKCKTTCRNGFLIPKTL